MSLDKEEYRRFVLAGIRSFREWYQPIDFGYGIIAHIKQPPDFIERKECFDNRTQGISRYEYIIKPNLPTIKGKRILDLGCSSGIFSVMLSLEGAKEVIGIDRPKDIRRRTNRYIHYRKKYSNQDVIEQANFVKKAFELRVGKELNVKFIGWDINDIKQLNLGRFDLIISLCTLYHELSRMPRILKTLSSMSDIIILQAHLGHGGRLKVWAGIDPHVEIMTVLGFRVNVVTGDSDYSMPLIVCMRSDISRNSIGSIYSRVMRFQYLRFKYMILSWISETRLKLSLIRERIYKAINREKEHSSCDV